MLLGPVYAVSVVPGGTPVFDASGNPEGVGVDVGVGVGDGVGEGEGVGVGLGVAVGEGDGVTIGVGVGTGTNDNCPDVYRRKFPVLSDSLISTNVRDGSTTTTVA